ncbi:MAG: sigma-54-dependent Fis family transcriptional regulator, partial [Planctomycetes bacterium]|nr:sigma-54-dependent Fis family transcriptional regulator [Planctomycetota bacterium]
QGESGTGKELIARAIHANGPRRSKPFVSENCAAIPATLLESEFFGYVRGAFTGAAKDKKGLFEVAHEGTLFLDEIGDLNLDLQTKFLRVLQEGEIRRVGGKNIIKVDVRILCATNRDLTAMIAKRHFREDLYYRINVINVRLPPLRERREDVPLLVDFFLGRSAAKLGMPKREISREALAVLCQHEWPGNIRELENEIERMAALSRGVMRVEDLSEQLRPREGSSAPLAEGASLKDIVARSTEEVEREAIVEGLRKHGWNKSKTADGLGIARPTLEAKIEKYGLTREVVMKGGA